MPTIKEQCEKRIREIVPELQELKFGCEIEPKQSLCGYGRSFIVVDYPSITRIDKKRRWDIEHLSDSAMSCRDAIDEDRFNIIGSPIHLEHILLAIDKVIDKRKYDMFSIAWNGLMSFHTKNNLSMLEYELDKSFADQKEQVYSFLLEIIK